MIHSRKLVIGICVIGAIGFALLLFSRPSSVSTIPESVESAPPLTKEYKNATYAFSVQTPADFEARELPPDEKGGIAIVLQGPSGDGIQILISAYPEDAKTITADDVRGSIPDMSVSEEQTIEIGANHRGVAFKSDNDAFGGASREVWFAYKGKLYQISTYARLDPLLKAMFATWKFF